MNKYMNLARLSLALTAMSAIAQNTFPATGDVGIGTTAPSSGFDLTVSGDGIFTNNPTNDSGVYITGQLGPYGAIQAVNSANTNLSNLALQPYGGWVGIGTAAPLGPLSIYRSVSAGLGGYLVLDNDAASSGDQTGIIFSDGNGGPLSTYMRAQILSTVESAPNYFGNLTFLTGIGSSLTENIGHRQRRHRHDITRRRARS
jgi:hypothetical protein